MELRLATQDEVSAELGRLASRLTHPNKLMAGVAAELLSIAEGNFERESSDGAKWESLSDVTIARREKKGHWPGKKLQVSAGGLAPSVKPFSSTHEAGISASKIYAAIQQLGGKAGRGKKVTIPARPYIPMRKSGDGFELSNEAQGAILQLMRDFMLRGST